MRKCMSMCLISTILVSTTGCATLMKSSWQSIPITSYPGGASVRVDGIEKGDTPMVIKMRRKWSHTVQLDKEGYESYEAAIASKSGGWIWGNILIGGIIGLIVDLLTGASNNLEPEKIEAELVSASATSGV